jgi:hypothetical protein
MGRSTFPKKRVQRFHCGKAILSFMAKKTNKETKHENDYNAFCGSIMKEAVKESTILNGGLEGPISGFDTTN